ncbi:MAG: serine hydrolase [Pseudomonadota bacterium]
MNNANFGALMSIKSSLFILLLALFGCSFAWAADTDAEAIPSLRECADSNLQTDLEQALSQLGLDRAAANGKLSVALVDITDLSNPRLAAVNGDRMMYAASLPKIAILLGAFVDIENGAFQLDREAREVLTRMVRVSSNRDATAMLNKVGKERVLEILQSERFKLYDQEQGGGLWIGKEYGKSPAYRRDPLHNLSHGATALQAARFYYLLETGQLVNPALSREMKSMLGNPGVAHKFVKGLKARPGTKIYRKSGSWRHWHADSALVENGHYKYIAVALADNAKGGQWLSRLITSLNDLIVPVQVANRD